MGLNDQLRRLSPGRARLAVCAALALIAASAGGALYYTQKGSATAIGENRDGGRRVGSPGNRPQPVKATAAKQGELEVILSALGTVTASNTATVRPRVDGQLVRVHFREGQVVRAGDMLAEIDPRPFQIQLDQARGQLAKDEALLSAARVDLERYRSLLAKDSIARQQVDTQEALVRQYQGTVEADRAAVGNARLQLDFTRITAPASGRLGLRQVDVGNNVRSADAGGIVVITQTEPIHVVFAIPADNLGDIVRRLQAGESLVTEAWNRDGRTLLAQGRLLSADNQIDVATGTVKLKAEFANTGNALFPNQFVNVRLKVETRRNATLLAAAAVQRNAQGPFAFVIDEAEQTAAPRALTLGPSGNDLVVVEKGLAPGEQVVLDGADRVRPGGKVEVLAIDDRAVSGDSADPAAREGDGRRRRNGGEGPGRRRE